MMLAKLYFSLGGVPFTDFLRSNNQKKRFYCRDFSSILNCTESNRPFNASSSINELRIQTVVKEP